MKFAKKARNINRTWTRIFCKFNRCLFAFDHRCGSFVIYGLLFERFLNPERISLPDIDIDFPDIDEE